MRARFLAVAVLVLLVCLPGTSQAEERAAPREMVDRLLNAPQPGRNPLDLAVRLRGLSPATPLVAVAPSQLVAGYENNFWILDKRSAQLFQAAATLRLVTDHAYWFVESDMADRAPQAAMVSRTRTPRNLAQVRSVLYFFAIIGMAPRRFHKALPGAEAKAHCDCA